ncbi:MAG: 4,5-dihydroxyphthalate decarboxylase [Solirubrobacteraceae bacterium]|nr:4,5-dihydroxyphthalate decarboxylase [Solirubrobacteraceae bacterium]
MSRNLPLTLACSDYDRTRALRDGRVPIDGCDLNYLPLKIEETFFRMLRHREFDVAEMSLSSYVVSHVSADPWLVAIPVFPSRSFRHAHIAVRTDRIGEPADLAGKVVGTPEFQLTANVWNRGTLADRHGVPVDSVRYRTAGLESPERPEKLKLDLPPEIDIAPLDKGMSLAEALARGEIDAIQAPREPSTLGAPGVGRLFEDFRAVEETYAQETGIFPIMHVVVLRRELHEEHPWLAGSLQKAFTAARDLAYAALRDVGALSTLLPWQISEMQRTQALLGDDWWAYGLDANRHVLDTFLRYHHEQGLSPRRVSPEELFAPSALEAFVV